MRWVYRGVVLVLLSGSMLLNGLQYVGGAFINGVYTLVEGITDIASASMLQKRKIASLDEMRVAQQGKLTTLESVVDKQKRELGALSQKTVTQQGKLKTLESVVDKQKRELGVLSQKTVAQQSKLKTLETVIDDQRVKEALNNQKRITQQAKWRGLQAKVTDVINRMFKRGAARVGVDAVTSPGMAMSGGGAGLLFLVATEAGFTYADISDQCDLLDDLNVWVRILDFEPQTTPAYCNYTPTQLAESFPKIAGFSESLKKTSASDIMGEYGRGIYVQIEQWREAYDDVTIVDSLNQKALDSWHSLRDSTESFGRRAKGKWADLLDRN